MKKLIAIGLGVLAIGGIGASNMFTGTSAVTLDTATAQQIVWDKPKTDSEWAEDVKKESFDIKSTNVLKTMIDSHTQKLNDLTKNSSEVVECPDCTRYYIKKQLENDKYQGDVAAETNRRYGEQLSQYQIEIEKLAQSVERMTNEVRLRDKGFLIVEGDAQPHFGSIVPPNRIRHIHD